MTVDDLSFPVLLFEHGFVSSVSSADELLTTTIKPVKTGYYRNQLIVDSTGKAGKIKDAKKLHHIGRFWGYDILLVQHIRMELIFKGEPFEMPLEELRKKTLSALRFDFGSIDPDYAREMKQRFREARSAAEIVSLVVELDDASKVRR